MQFSRRMVMCLSVALAGTGAQAADFFQPLSLDHALKQAAARGKLVFVLVVKDACEACGWMEGNVLANADVAASVGAKTIPIRVNTDKDGEFARTYDITEHPTLLFLKPDGSVADRHNGGWQLQPFLAFANGVLNGKDTLSAAREAASGSGEKNPYARNTLADVLIQWHRYPEALEHLLWCFDEGHKQATAEGVNFRDVRLLFPLSDIASLAGRYPPARDALLRRRDAAREKVLAGTADRDETAEFAAINVKLGQDNDNLAAYEQLRKEHPESSTLTYLRLRVFDTLLQQQRYAELNAAFDVLDDARQHFARYKQRTQVAENMSSEQQAALGLAQLRIVVAQTVARDYEVLLAVGRDAEATALALKLLDFDKSAPTYAALAAAAVHAGKCTTEHLDYAKQALELAGGNDAQKIALVAQLYAQLGRRGEAIDLLAGKISAVKTKEDKQFLQSLVDSLRATPPTQK
ncbi:MAG TPA: thioredoxin family protein [Phycisphaerae bacterium]